MASKSYRPKADYADLVIDVTVEKPQGDRAGTDTRPEDLPGLGVEIVSVGKGNLAWPVDEDTLVKKGVLNEVSNHPLVTDEPERGGGSGSGGDGGARRGGAGKDGGSSGEGGDK